MRRTHEFRSTAELGVYSGRRDFCDRFASPHQCPGIGLHARTRFDGDGFTGKHGLIEQYIARGDAHIGGDHAA